MLLNRTVTDFVEVVSSKEPVPGGGSVSALCASLGSALGEMVANLTVGKKKYVEVEADMKVIAEKLCGFKIEFLELVEKDADSYDAVMQAFKLPKETDEDKSARSAAIQSSMKGAADVPYKVAEKAYEIMPFIKDVAVRGNTNAVTDAAVAAMLARTAVIGAIYNVKINLGSIKDEAYVTEMTEKITRLQNKAVKMETEILGSVEL